MATDGVKIIDGDLANDIYWGFMDMYDGGIDVSDIMQRYPVDVDYYSDFDYEVFITVYALALWEVGALTDDILDKVKTTIDKGVGEASWAESHGQKAGKERGKELDKLWVKINTLNLKIRKRKKYKLITKPVFNEDSVLVFQLPNGNYGVTILLTIHQYRGKCTYRFGKILYNEAQKPTTDIVLQLPIAGNNIPSLIDPYPFLAQDMDKILEQGGLEVVLKNEALRTGQYISALSQTSVSHHELLLISNKFEQIGQIKIISGYKYVSSLNWSSSFEDFCSRFIDLEDYVKRIKGDWFFVSQLVEATSDLQIKM